jgi:hypothetical protein
VNAIAHLLRGPAVSSLLKKLGIDPRRFWLLTDLFGQLSERGEMMDQLGRNGVGLKTAALLYCGLSGIVSLAMVATQSGLATYFGTFIGMTAFLLVSVLLSETGNSLVNPTEGLILAHQPVNGATYTAAKLTHLGRIILYLVPALNVIPAALALVLKECRWYHPLLHLLAALTVGLVAALLCCALYGWLIRFIPVKRLKAAGQLASTIPFLFMMWSNRVTKLASNIRIPDWIPSGEAARWSIFIAAGFGVCAIVALGLRSLSADYLIRVSSMTKGGSSAGAGGGRSLVGGIVERFFGGQAGRAGFSFVARMMLRDWQFRRQMIPLAVPAVLFSVPLVTNGWRMNPFMADFSWMHAVPHVFGAMLFFVCSLLHWGTDYKGAWMFHLAPSGAFFRFARGVHALLWIEAIVIPHVVLFALLSWPWGIRSAGMFTAYSVAVASVYLGLELRLIDGIPFSRQVDTSASAVMLPVMMIGGIAMSLVVALQHFILFRSPQAVLAATVVAAIAAFYLTRASLGSFEITMRHHLALQSVESGTLYKEVNA